MVDMVAVYKALSELKDLNPDLIVCRNCELELSTGHCPYRMTEDEGMDIEEHFCKVHQIIQDTMDTIQYQEELLKKATGITWKDGHPVMPHEEESEQKGKYNSIGYDQLKKVLTDAGVLRKCEPAWEYDCERRLFCESVDGPFEIEWWINLCYLKINGTIVPFHWVRITDTWPGNGIRTELKFQNSPDRFMNPGDIVAILPLSYRQKEEA